MENTSGAARCRVCGPIAIADNVGSNPASVACHYSPMSIMEVAA